MDQFTLRNYVSAIADFTKAIELTPNFSLAYLMRGIAKYREETGTLQDKHDPLVSKAHIHSALEDMEYVIKLSPNMAVAHYDRGVVLASIQDYTSALSSFNKAIEIKPDFGEAYYNRGYVYLKLGNKEAGTNDLSKAGELGVVPSYNLLKRMTR